MGSDELIAGRYQLLRQLGSGGQGEVWRARDVELNRVVAMKRSSAADRERGRAQNRREAVQGAALTHPNVIMVLTSFAEGEDHWVVTEHFESRDLAVVVAEEGPLSPERAARLGEQLAAALAAVHQAGIVHQDVKPGNVLLADNGQAKLTDLGIARWAEETGGDAGAQNLTPGFAAPEVARGEPATGAADVFSLGATLFAAVTGQSPWGGPEISQQGKLARASVCQLAPHHQDGPLGTVLDLLLHQDPRRRPSAEDARGMLAEVATGSELTIRIPPPPRRRRWPVFTAVGAVLAVAAAAAVFWPWDALPEDRTRLLGDARTVDPCALVDAAALSRFGQAVLDADYGNFNRCRVLVRMKPADPSDEVQVQVQLQGFPGAHTPSPTATAVGVQRPVPRGDECERTVQLPDGHRIRVRAAHLHDRPAPLCDMAETLTTGVLVVLNQGQVKRRATEAPPDSLRSQDACALLTTAELDPVIGVVPADPGFGNWNCEWVRGRREVLIEFDRKPPLAARKGGRSVDFGGSSAGLLRPDSDSCEADLPHRATTDAQGRAMIEVVRLHLTDDTVPPEQLCEPVAELAKAVAGRLPR